MKTGSARLGDYLVLRILRVSNFCMSKIYIKEPLNKEQNDGRIDIIQYIGGMTGKRIDRHNTPFIDHRRIDVAIIKVRDGHVK